MGNFSLKSYINSLWSLLYPDVCKKCGTDLFGNDEILCKKCAISLPRTFFEKSGNSHAAQLFWGKIAIQYVSPIFYYRKGETLQKLIHLLKYKNRRDVGIFLGRLIGRILLHTTFEPPFDVIIPVPLHHKRLKIRGYNQCEALAEGLSEVTNIPVAKNVLIREKYNVSQTRKNRFDRWTNVDGIFKLLNVNALVNKHVLVIDDILTTGSTLEACCTPLTEAKGVKISIVTVGYTSV